MKIFIADDDKVLRNGIRKIIETNAAWCKVEGEASNGALALDELQKLDVDLLISDIKMPVMDGIQLIKNIKALSMRIKIIVLSGYDEYRYVREALISGASDYLLKPVESVVLLDLLNKIKTEIENEIQIEHLNASLSRKLSESMPLLKEKFLLELIKGNEADGGRILHKLKTFGMEGIEHFYFAVVKADECLIKRNSLNNDLPESYVKQKVDEVLNAAGSPYSLQAQRDGEVGILFLGQLQEEDFKKSVDMALKQLMETLRNENTLTVTIGLSQIHKSLAHISAAYSQALMAQDRRFYEGKDRLIPYSAEDCSYHHFNEGEIGSQVDALINSIEIGDAGKAKKLISDMIDKLYARNINPVEFRETLESVVSRIFNLSNEFKGIAELYNIEGMDMIAYINAANTYAELREALVNAFYGNVAKINCLRAERGKKIVNIAKEYIRANYSRELSLKAIADHVYLNACYFSELFKNETGKNFVDYVMEVRINAAKELLADYKIKVYEVGQLVGYIEPVSFNRAFKRVVGISPAEYRKLI
jgi:Response regulator containing CheY-like receiver domain and AraC-type DNA-binding domain